MKIFKLVKFIFNILLTIFIFIFKDIFLHEKVLKYFIGSIICIYAIDAIFPVIFKDKEYYKEDKFYHGIVELILGLSTIIFFNDYECICIVWGVWAILREANELKELFIFEKIKLVKYLSIIESIIAIAFSIMLIAEAGKTHALTHMYLLALELFTAVVFPQISHFIDKKLSKENNK